MVNSELFPPVIVPALVKVPVEVNLPLFLKLPEILIISCVISLVFSPSLMVNSELFPPEIT